MKPLIVLTLLAPLWLSAQTKLYVVEQGTERAVGESYDFGTVAAGDLVEKTFRVRNTSSGPVRLTSLNLAGPGFTFAGLPQWPLDIAAGGMLELVVRFHPLIPGLYPAYLNINSIRTAILLGKAVAGLMLSVEEGAAEVPVTVADTVDFGVVAIGSRAIRRFHLSNPTSEPLTVTHLAVTGAAFRAGASLPAPIAVDPQQPLSFEVVFEPKSAGLAQGEIEMNQRRYSLSGRGVEPEFPRPQIAVDPQVVAAGRQVKIAIRLESRSRYPGSGELSMEFTPAVSGKGDPAVMFPATGSRTASFTVAENEDVARFGDRAEIEFQTGTTAGSIVFTARLGRYSEQLTIVVPQGPVVVDSSRPVRSATGFEIQVAAFDTSRSASRLAFTFFDRDGSVVAPGAIQVDASAPFRQYFENSDFGGMFLLRAVFPVTGNALRIIAYEVEIINSQGTAKTQRIGIQ